MIILTDAELLKKIQHWFMLKSLNKQEIKETTLIW
jgi:hypothetical protein